MNRIIAIKVKDKIAAQTNDTVYICGNSDFVIKFDFDDEWAEHECKTARFVIAGRFIDVVFSNDECHVPVISNTHNFVVGVYAGNLQTTTPAYVPASKSILCGTEVPAPPHPDVYEQMKELFEAGLNEAWESANAAKEAQDAIEGMTATSETLDVGAKAKVTKSVQNGVVNLHFGIPSGEDGKDGKDGANGKDGRDGKDGANGKDGYTPIKGVDYFDGKNGIDGKNGVDGKPGQPGAQGIPGMGGRSLAFHS